MNRKAWIQIVEATISMMILFGLSLGLMQEKAEKPDISKQAYKIQHQILTEAQDDYCIRNAVLNRDETLLKRFIAKRLCHLPYNFTIDLCDPTEACLFPDKDKNRTDKDNKVITKKGIPKPKDQDIYADNMIIAANLSDFAPVKISFFAWSGGTKCEEYECNVTAELPPTEEGCKGDSTRTVSCGVTECSATVTQSRDCIDGQWGSWKPECQPKGPSPINCGNGKDNDCNGEIDANEPICVAPTAICFNADGPRYRYNLYNPSNCANVDCNAISYDSEARIPGGQIWVSMAINSNPAAITFNPNVFTLIGSSPAPPYYWYQYNQDSTEQSEIRITSNGCIFSIKKY
jgi:hypothetical protein